MICPLLASCKKEVTHEHYLKYCSNIREDMYKKCEHYIEITKMKRTPVEWSKLISMG